jgi:hypothetical protein
MKLMTAAMVWCLAVALAAAGEAPAVGPSAPELRDELIRRVKQDQEARTAITKWIKEHGMVAGPTGADMSDEHKQAFQKVAGRVQEIDAENTKWLKRVVREHGWPTYSLVGEDGGGAAWLLVQHADADVKFQRRCLDLMQELPKEEVSLTNIALLTDRVLLAEGKKQLYGTQFATTDGKLVPRPIEDEEHVDERRASVGLPPMSEYRQQLEQVYGHTTEK